jgi:hypothetical protein
MTLVEVLGITNPLDLMPGGNKRFLTGLLIPRPEARPNDKKLYPRSLGCWHEKNDAGRIELLLDFRQAGSLSKEVAQNINP